MCTLLRVLLHRIVCCNCVTEVVLTQILEKKNFKEDDRKIKHQADVDIWVMILARLSENMSFYTSTTMGRGRDASGFWSRGPEELEILKKTINRLTSQLSHIVSLVSNQ